MAHTAAYLDEMGEEHRPHNDPMCRYPGCDQIYRLKGERRRSGTGNGYCMKHYRAWLRSGNPAGKKAEIASRLLDAVNRYCDNRVYETKLALCLAVMDCGEPQNLRVDYGMAVPLMAATAPGTRLAMAAHAWGECPAEAPIEEYLRIREEFFLEANRFRKGFYRRMAGLT